MSQNVKLILLFVLDRTLLVANSRFYGRSLSAQLVAFLYADCPG